MRGERPKAVPQYASFPWRVARAQELRGHTHPKRGDVAPCRAHALLPVSGNSRVDREGPREART